MIITGDCLEKMKLMQDKSIDCIITSPPYWGLRDYGSPDQLGMERTPEKFTENLVLVFHEAKRILKDDGTLWLNLGDSYASKTKGTGGKTKKQSTNKGSFHSDIKQKFDHGLKEKDLVGIPWRVAFALQQDGWYLRQDIIWYKPNPMPESVRDRCTKSHEYIFLLSKSKKYYFDVDAIKEPSAESTYKRLNQDIENQKGSNRVPFKTNGPMKAVGNLVRNKRSVWSVTTKPFKGAHFATFPQDLIEPCLLAGCPENGIVLDPFFGAGTVGVVAKKHKRNFIGIELNPEYVTMAEKRLEERIK